MDSDKWTDSELERLEKRIAEQYEQAQKELGEKAQAYFKQYEERFKREELAMLTTSLTKDEVEELWVKLYGNNAGFERWFKTADHAYGQTETEAKLKFQRWEYAQLGRGQHWNDMRDQMAQRLTETNQIAAGYINGVLPSIYAANSNGVAAIAEKAAMKQGVQGVSFDLVDEYTVRNLMAESSAVRPYKPVNISIDESTKYSKNKLQNALLQGILQGDSIDEIADRFEAVTGMNKNAAIRNARTATTNARNAGKQDRFNDLKSKGCTFTKIWVATRDARTRSEHIEANGQEVDSDSTFDVGGEELMYPADPSASGWNRYNCRCTMRTGKIRFNSVVSDEVRNDSKYKNKLNLFELSASMKKRPDEYNHYTDAEKALIDYLINCTEGTILSDYDSDFVNAINGLAENCGNETALNLWNKMKDNVVIGGDALPSAGAFTDPIDKKIYFNKENDLVGDEYEKPYSGSIHEMFHVYDDLKTNANDNKMHSYLYDYNNGELFKTAKEEIEGWMIELDKQGRAEFADNINNADWLFKHKYITEDEHEEYKKSGILPDKELKYNENTANRKMEEYLFSIPQDQVYIISDVVQSIANDDLVVPYGHKQDYWDERRVCSEFGSNMYSGILTNPKAVDIVAAKLPKTSSKLFEIYETM